MLAELVRHIILYYLWDCTRNQKTEKRIIDFHKQKEILQTLITHAVNVTLFVDSRKMFKYKPICTAMTSGCNYYKIQWASSQWQGCCILHGVHLLKFRVPCFPKKKKVLDGFMERLILSSVSAYTSWPRFPSNIYSCPWFWGKKPKPKIAANLQNFINNYLESSQIRIILHDQPDFNGDKLSI